MSNFDDEFEKAERHGSVMGYVVLVLLVVGILGFFYVSYQVIYLISAEDWSNGIKPVIERLWCGKAGCFND